MHCIASRDSSKEAISTLLSRKERRTWDSVVRSSSASWSV